MPGIDNINLFELLVRRYSSDLNIELIAVSGTPSLPFLPAKYVQVDPAIIFHSLSTLQLNGFVEKYQQQIGDETSEGGDASEVFSRSTSGLYDIESFFRALNNAIDDKDGRVMTTVSSQGYGHVC